jgi:hypothetical protein
MSGCLEGAAALAAWAELAVAVAAAGAAAAAEAKVAVAAAGALPRRLSQGSSSDLPRLASSRRG